MLSRAFMLAFTHVLDGCVEDRIGYASCNEETRREMEWVSGVRSSANKACLVGALLKSRFQHPGVDRIGNLCRVRE